MAIFKGRAGVRWWHTQNENYKYVCIIIFKYIILSEIARNKAEKLYGEFRETGVPI